MRSRTLLEVHQHLEGLYVTLIGPQQFLPSISSILFPSSASQVACFHLLEQKTKMHKLHIEPTHNQFSDMTYLIKQSYHKVSTLFFNSI